MANQNWTDPPVVFTRGDLVEWDEFNSGKWETLQGKVAGYIKPSPLEIVIDTPDGRRMIRDSRLMRHYWPCNLCGGTGTTGVVVDFGGYDLHEPCPNGCKGK